MTLNDRQLFLESFWEDCLRITKDKGRDYNPDNIPLMDVLNTAIETGTSVHAVLWTYYAKHASAIRRHFSQGETLASEPILGRLMDAANYLGMMAFFETHRAELYATWRTHWEGRTCECVFHLDETTTISVNEHPLIRQACQRCETLHWLATQESSLASGRTSSDSTPKAQD